MPTMLETVLPTDNGLFLLRDVAANTADDQRAAFQASRIPGSRAGRRVAAAGPVLLVRCAHQYTRPHVRVDVLGGTPDDDGPWQWEERMRLVLPTGVVTLDADPTMMLDLPHIDLGAGPGSYGLSVGHVGRAEAQEAAREVAERTITASLEETRTAWQSLDAIERYLIRLWPLERHPS
ncbi:hypothetical protein MRQ36_27595 [Micromonospora sp. R77]|uniref:hypothetical protein n=1 Tax=Micromonospora sp. R77 TaxID=2925836 RepID=UPI001F601763|nr:hypothetical protein [Micromonospora sp. R77]MCI4066108.1 hypothetical protein [Micromonospora sp. R77]